MTDDVELLRRYARDHSEEAFTELVNRHIDLVYSAALHRLGSERRFAEDVTQEVFRDLVRKAPSLLFRSNLTGWLYTSARFSAARMIRNEQHRRHREEEAHRINEVDAPTFSPEGLEQLEPIMAETIERLSPRDREAVLLRFFEKRPFADIGAMLGVSEDAAQKRVERALQKLREAFARRGVTSTISALSLTLANQSMIAAPAALAGKVTGAALAAGTTSGALAGGAIVFMSTAKTTVSIATIMAISAIGYGIAQRARAQTMAQELANLRGERATLAVQLAEAERRSQPAETTAPAAEQEAPPASSPAPTTTVHAAVQPAFESTMKALASISMAGGRLVLDSGHIANVRTWVNQDPSGLTSWIATATLPGSKQREHTTEAIVEIVTETNPEFAFQLVGSFESERIRTSRRLNVVRAWAHRDPLAVARAVIGADLSETDRKQLLSHIEMIGLSNAAR